MTVWWNTRSQGHGHWSIVCHRIRGPLGHDGHCYQQRVAEWGLWKYSPCLPCCSPPLDLPCWLPLDLQQCSLLTPRCWLLFHPRSMSLPDIPLALLPAPLPVLLNPAFILLPSLQPMLLPILGYTLLPAPPVVLLPTPGHMLPANHPPMLSLTPRPTTADAGSMDLAQEEPHSLELVQGLEWVWHPQYIVNYIPYSGGRMN